MVKKKVEMQTKARTDAKTQVKAQAQTKLAAQAQAKLQTNKIKNSVKGQPKPMKWPVRLAWAGYALVVVFLLMMGPGALMIETAVPERWILAEISTGVTATAGVLALVGLVLGTVSAVQTYRKQSKRMREVMTLVGGAAVGLLLGMMMVMLQPFKGTESYVILLTLLAFLPGAIAGMIHWLMPTEIERKKLQLISLVITMGLIVIELVVGTATVAQMFQDVIGSWV